MSTAASFIYISSEGIFQIIHPEIKFKYVNFMILLQTKEVIYYCMKLFLVKLSSSLVEDWTWKKYESDSC